MTIPPPPGLGNSSSSAIPGIAPGITPPIGGQFPGSPRSASPLPLVAGVIALALSIADYIYASSNSQLDSSSSDFFLHVLGYMLTPFAMVLFLAWDLVAQRAGMKDINFFPRRKYSSMLRMLTATSFVIAIFHIVNISWYVAEKISS